MIFSARLVFAFGLTILLVQNNVAGLPGQNERAFANVCANCIVSNGYGFNSYEGDCSCYWTCVLQRAGKLMSNPANDWVSYKRCCPCELVWSQKLLTCVDYTHKLSDCFRREDTTNQCDGLAAGTYLPRTDPDSVQDGDYLCSGYVECVQVGPSVVPRTQCCPAGECYDDQAAGIPCSTAACTGDCADSEDCTCEEESVKLHECPYVSVTDDPSRFMGRENMKTYVCAPGTCWSEEDCTCVRANNTGYNDCIPWLEMDFDMNQIKAVSGRGHSMWLEYRGVTLVPNGALNTPYYARLDGHGDEINLAAVANAYFGNTLVIRYFFRLENNYGPSVDIDVQTLLTNCYDDSENGLEDPTIDVCVVRDGGTGNGRMVTTFVTYNRGWFMDDSSMSTATINLEVPLSVDVWYEYWLIYCGDDGRMYNAILDNSGSVLRARSFPVTDSKFIVDSQSGFVWGQSLEGFKHDFDGGIDEILLYRCKPTGSDDFNMDFSAIREYIHGG